MTLAKSNYVSSNTFAPLPWQVKPWQDTAPIMLLSSGSGTGKCQVGDTKVTMSDGSVKNLIDVSVGDKVLSFTDNGYSAVGEVEATEYAGKKEVIKIRTKSGKITRLSHDHPLKVGIRYKKAADIKVGDFLHSARQTGFGTGYKEWEEAMVVAYIAASGNTTDGKIFFDSFDDESLFDFNEAVSAIGSKLIVKKEHPSKIYTVEVVGKDGKNPVLDLATNNKMMNMKQNNMRLPDWVFNLEKDMLSEFINTLYSMKGWAYNGQMDKQKLIGFRTSSEQLASDMSMLLQKYGIHPVCTRLQTVGIPSFILTIESPGGIKTFYEEIGGPATHSVMYRDLYESILETRLHDKHGEFIPIALIDDATVLVPHILRTKHFESVRKMIRSNIVKGVHRPALYRWQEEGKTITSEILEYLNNDIVYDEVVSIEQTNQEADMYDIQVKDTENYCANGFNSHNSRLAAEKVHAFLLRYPGATGLVVRKTRASMVNSTIAFFRHTVIGNTPGIIYRPAAFRFDYPNGSALVMGGMKDEDQREHIRSIGQNGSVDIAWMEEATQFNEKDYNEILARMRGVAGPFTQVILTTNPEGPMHWIYVNLIMDAHKDKRVSLYQPSVYDNIYNSEDYIKNNLERLSGVQRARLLEGRWVQATGLVFDNWRDAPEIKDTNVTIDAEYIPGGGVVTWWIDDGVTGEMKNGVFTARSHPRAILFAQMQSNGTLNVFDESYMIGRVATDHLEEMINYSFERGYELPAYIVRDRAAASLGAAIRDLGLKDKFNPVKIDESITEMYSWIDPGDAKIRRFRVHPRCKHFRNEMLNFGRNSKTGRIVKAYDHGVDAARYGIWDNVVGVRAEIDVASYYQDNDTGFVPDVRIRPYRRKSGIDIATY